MDNLGGFLLAEAEAVRVLAGLSVALAIGLVIGLEREWSQTTDGHTHFFAGARTFALTGLLGGVCAFVPPMIAGVALAAVAALSVLAYSVAARASEARGGTTEIALLLAFALGFLAGEGMTLAASAAGVATAGLLSAKRRIGAAAAALTAREVRAILLFLAVTVIVLPVLPGEALPALGGASPRALWGLVVLISGLSFAGYWLTRAFGPRRGALMTGLVGGLASSTATTISLARLSAAEPALAAPAAAGIVAANMVMVGRLGVLTALLSPLTLGRLWPSLLVAGGVGAAWIARRVRFRTGEAVSPAALSLTNPFELRPAIVFAGLLVLISLLSQGAAQMFGDKGLYVLAAVTGFADADAVALSVLRLAIGDSGTSVATAAQAIWIAAAANMAAKAALAGLIGGRALAIRTVPPLLLAAMAGGAALVVFPGP